MKRIASILLGVAVLLGSLQMPMQAQAKENVVIMIDPGHGGSNLGANPPGYLEKEMTLVTAMAMKTELEKYEGVTVYMTRTGDAELSLEQRAQLAKSVNADFLYSLHYNMSANHFFYGSEVWAQSTGVNYTKGYSQGQLLLNEFTNAGLFSRGVKVKLGKSGNEYYGILRNASALGVPAVIVEHCHLDHANDAEHYNSIEKLQAFGRSDATAVAKYFGLSSKTLGVDYSDYPKANVTPVATPKVQDLTPPEVAAIRVTGNDENNKTVSLAINAADSNTGIMYYAYSTDGGASWSSLQIWPSATDTLSITVPAKYGVNRAVSVAVFNSYDGMTISNTLTY
ncbi:MAG: N-acetylmuramoyl-L-alanine amidase [Lachnospiraceae bacterium]|nr:N-acetylmuramoyl-L-alanine amidase [Lachnospiraceae bacterium]